MRNTVPAAYAAVPTALTLYIGHVRRNPLGHLHRNVGHDPGITGHVEPEYSPAEALSALLSDVRLTGVATTP